MQPCPLNKLQCPMRQVKLVPRRPLWLEPLVEVAEKLLAARANRPTEQKHQKQASITGQVRPYARGKSIPSGAMQDLIMYNCLVLPSLFLCIS